MELSENFDHWIGFYFKLKTKLIYLLYLRYDTTIMVKIYSVTNENFNQIVNVRRGVTRNSLLGATPSTGGPIDKLEI